MAKFDTVRGMRDFLPEDMILRQEAFDKIRKVLEQYGFLPWEGPALENEKLLKAKSVEPKEIYKFKDRGGRSLVLRPEKTQTIARILGSNPNIAKPFKVYNFGRVWRYDRPQKGRYREFWQVDMDIFGVDTPLADAEIIACANDCIKAVGIEKFKFKINNRNLINQLLIDVGVSTKLLQNALRAIDKLDKLGEDAVGKELKKKGVSTETIADLLELIKTKGNLEKIKKSFTINDELLKELEEFEFYLKQLGVTNYEWNLSLVRGLDYYTGFVFEISPERSSRDAKNSKNSLADAAKGIGSIGGGGRYDSLVKVYSRRDVPATGLALGFERIMTLIKEKKKTTTQVFVIPVGTQVKSIKLVQQLRKKGINVDIDLIGRGISRNFKYVDKMGIPFALVIGEKELKTKKFTLKNMKTGKERKVTLQQLIRTIK